MAQCWGGGENFSNSTSWSHSAPRGVASGPGLRSFFLAVHTFPWYKLFTHLFVSSSHLHPSPVAPKGKVTSSTWLPALLVLCPWAWGHEYLATVKYQALFPLHWGVQELGCGDLALASWMKDTTEESYHWGSYHWGKVLLRKVTTEESSHCGKLPLKKATTERKLPLVKSYYWGKLLLMKDTTEKNHNWLKLPLMKIATEESYYR